jgi:hypothetical protein
MDEGASQLSLPHLRIERTRTGQQQGNATGRNTFTINLYRV